MTTTTVGEFLNHPVIKQAADLEIFFTRSRSYKKNGQATIESKNSHLVRKYGFCYRYDTPEERVVLNRFWRLAGDRISYLTPTRKPNISTLQPSPAPTKASDSSTQGFLTPSRFTGILN